MIITVQPIYNYPTMLPCNKTAVNRRIGGLAMSRIQTHNYKFHLIPIGIQPS